MSFDVINENLRSIKTKKALYDAMFSLLKKHNFKQITIKGICEEALISRATFYTHFIDKYDLLEHWITELWPKNSNNYYTYEQIEKIANHHMHENMSIIKNLIYDADNETFEILFKFILSTINLTVEKNNNNETFSKNIVLSNFYAGGILSYLLWQVKNKFPSDIPPMNKHFYKIIHEFQKWNQNSDKIGGDF